MKILGYGWENPSPGEFEFFEFPNDEHIIGTTVDNEAPLSLDGDDDNPEFTAGLEAPKLDDDTSSLSNAASVHGDNNSETSGFFSLNSDFATAEPEGSWPPAQFHNATDSSASPAWQALNGWEAVGSQTLPDLPVADARGGKRGPPDTNTDPLPDDGPPTTATATYTSGTADTLSFDFYNISIDFYGDLWTSNSALYEAFVASADYLSSIITVGLQDDIYFGSYYEQNQIEISVDDLVIEAYLTDIDGAGGVLGQAGPTYARSSDGVTIDGLSVAGIMEFDVADATSLLSGGLWDDTVFHEMMHVLGFGTLWDMESWSLVGDQTVMIDDNGTKRPTDDITGYEYLGAANNSYDGGAFIPVESGGGSGTARGHWSEAALGNEIMTGYIDESNYLSDVSVAALADLGYELASSDYAALANPLSSEIVLSSQNQVDLVIA